MRFFIYSLMVLSAITGLSCQQNVKNSPIAANERTVEKPPPAPTPDQFGEISLVDKFSKQFDEKAQPTALTFGEYEIKPVTVRKKYKDGMEEADIFDAILSKNGKTIARFEGEFYPLGNFMSFGLFPFLGSPENQLFVLDETYKFDRNWIISVKPKYEVLFDSKDYGIWWGRLSVVDIDRDGVYELSLNQSMDFGLASYNAETPWSLIVFKYDPKARKYTPANHLFTNYSLSGIDERIQKYKAGEEKNFRDFVEIMLDLFYAGKETEAWKFFDENFMTQFSNSVVTRDKEKTREMIRTGLEKDPIYRFVHRDLRGQK